MNDEQRDSIRKQAKILAMQSRKSEPHIAKIYCFPHDTEVHLVETDDMTAESISGLVEVFYLDPSPEEGITTPSGIAIIRPDEFGKFALPPEGVIGRTPKNW